MIVTLKHEVIYLLKQGWHSTFGLNYILKTSCAGTRISDIRKDPSAGYKLAETSRISIRHGRNYAYKTFRLIGEKI